MNHISTWFLSVACAIVLGCTFSSSVLAHGGGAHPPLAAHLAFKNGSVHLHASFMAGPVVGSESILMLEAKDAKTHQPFDLSDDIEVSLFMPGMGHGSAPSQVERVLDSHGNIVTGAFKVRSMYFTMAGDWDVTVTLTDNALVKETQTFAVKLEGQGSGGHAH